ncbi:MAG: hypothetical protein H6625_10130 [Bdellovibrionaceae bacterium]|nr:hypothetical protein [Pseudobdellovibrionaceae bacterium]
MLERHLLKTSVTGIGLAMLVFFASYVASAETVYVLEIKTKGVDEASLETVKELISSAVQSEGHSLTSNKNEADSILRPALLKLGDSFILKIDKLKDNKVKYSSKMKAANLEDMDTVSTRVVRSVLNEEAPSKSVKVTDVTADEETRGTRRFKATRQFRFGFGPAWSSGLNVNGGGTQWSLGYIWGIDPDYDLKLNWSFYVPRADEENARYSELALGMNYFMTQAKHSPYLSIELGYASAAASEKINNLFNYSDDNASGWALGVGLGYKFFRTSTVNVGLLASYKYLFDKTDKSDQTPRLGSLNILVFY